MSAIELDLAQWPAAASTARSSNSRDEWHRSKVTKRPEPVPTVAITPSPQIVQPPATVPEQGVSGTTDGYASTSQVSRPPRPLNPIKPLYPEAAKRANIEGVVILQVDIDATGVVKKVGVIQGLGYGCDEQAISAVNQTAWDPALDKNNQPVATKVKIPFRFKFE